jgi:hypothetical protein
MTNDGPSGDVPHSDLSGDQRSRLEAEGYTGSESQIEASSAGQNLKLWVGVLGSAIVWFIGLQINYPLGLWACATKNHWILYVASALLLLLAAAPGWVAWRQVQIEGSGERESAGAGRRRFMAVLGLLLSGLFLLLIAAQAVPTFFIDPCLQ